MLQLFGAPIRVEREIPRRLRIWVVLVCLPALVTGLGAVPLGTPSSPWNAGGGLFAPQKGPSPYAGDDGASAVALDVVASAAIAEQERAPEPESTRATSGKKIRRRDPFRSLVIRPDDLLARNLPPGKRGLLVQQLTVDGIVRTPAGRLAVVNMQGKDRAFFLRAGDELYDGTVGEVREDSVVFRVTSVDAFGNRYQRSVVKPLSVANGNSR